MGIQSCGRFSSFSGRDVSTPRNQVHALRAHHFVFCYFAAPKSRQTCNKIQKLEELKASAPVPAPVSANRTLERLLVNCQVT